MNSTRVICRGKWLFRPIRKIKRYLLKRSSCIHSCGYKSNTLKTQKFIKLKDLKLYYWLFKQVFPVQPQFDQLFYVCIRYWILKHFSTTITQETLFAELRIWCGKIVIVYVINDT